MARGKYAAKAAEQRAAAAADTVDTLKAQLAEERAAAARDIAALKTENQRLAGQLTSAVKTMAAAEVERVRTEARELAQAERDQRHTKTLEAVRYLQVHHSGVDYEEWMKFLEMLGIEPGEAVGHYDIPRAARRVGADKARKAMSMVEQGYQLGGKRPW